ncbi:hypothetical protein [Micromonospora sp. NPDC092111]|uniref:hypothetical protein n=1 Tax=Micromonospora sp. NPDC092111 TaxID=3364289 RepID=UPI00382ECB94
MLPVALTSPLWWVARWSVRLLTGLAVAVALSLGAPALPEPVELPTSLSFGLAAPPAAPTGSAPVVLLSGPTAGDLPASYRSVAGPTHGPVLVTGATGDRQAGTAGTDVLPHPAGPGRLVPAAPASAPAGRAPAVAGPRAPPAG